MKGHEGVEERQLHHPATKSGFANGTAWMNGAIIPVGDAKVSVLDWGLTHSDITYDVVSAWDGKFFRIDDYVARFLKSVAAMRLNIAMDADAIKRILHEMVGASGLRRSYVSMVASRGVQGVPGSRDPRDCINHFYAWCVPFVWLFSEEVTARGAHLYLPGNLHRIGRSSVDPKTKNYHWGDFTHGMLDAREGGFDSVALMDKKGHLTEGPGFNMFIVRDGQILTPRHGVLEGITRRTAIEIGAALGRDCQETNITREMLMEADEVFVSTTGGGMIGVTRINERTFSNGKPGPVTKAIQNTYWEWHNDPSMSEVIDYR